MQTRGVILGSALVAIAVGGCGDDVVIAPTGGAGGIGGDTTTTTTGPGPGGGGEGAIGGGGDGGGGGGAGGGGNGGGGAGGEGPLGDTCADAVVLALSPGMSTQISGDTSLLNDDYYSAEPGVVCGDDTPAADAADVVFQIEVQEAGSLTVDVAQANGSTLDPALYQRSTCDDNANEFCFNTGVGESFAKHVEPGTYFIIIDGANGTSGEFDLTVSFGAPICGDGIINLGEECDFGAASPNDGCVDPGDAFECTLEAPDPNANVCPGVTLPVPGNTTTVFSGTTAGYTNNYDSLVCTSAPGGVERVFAFTPLITGTLTACVGNDTMGVPYCDDINDPLCLDWVIYARSTCETQGTELDCEDGGFDTVECVVVPVVEDTPVYVFVDGYDADPFSSGPFNLDVTLVP